MDVLNRPALRAVADATRGTSYENDLFLVGGAVRDLLLTGDAGEDLDLVTTGNALDLAKFLWKQRLSSIPPVLYERFGTAMVVVAGEKVELVTARKESYDATSRKPHVEPATLREDTERRDFTLNALLLGIHDGELRDPLGSGLEDLRNGVLRTPLDPVATFEDDPLRMLRAVRFRHRFGFSYAPGLEESIRGQRERLRIISSERIRDEVTKMLLRPSAPAALDDLRRFGLLDQFAPELTAMVGVTQGDWHDADVWDHTLRVVGNLWAESPPPDAELVWSALLHDIGKPDTRAEIDGHIRFFGHEKIGEEIARRLLNRLRFSGKEIDAVTRLVRNHMRLGTTPEFSDAAARRLLRDLGPLVDPLIRLVDADANALREGVRMLNLEPIRVKIEAIRAATPPEKLESPLTGEEIMAATGVKPGPELGRLKNLLREAVLDGRITPDDKEGARTLLQSL